ncbi:HTH domain-containing protein [Lactobacillus delbrueckii]|uniref:HTH domain-containing protein n=1 Tax=Lactobacillus delbrueckii TaxID=1584 RepID=UPI001F3689F5|nr:HTH domain-containing protein [Lactobacillus delbrueckii]GHN40561.1 hypothetical protein ME795_18430 [Lactobacillus delbrueckii]GHN55712.1 hypothetical protein ME803_16610 [Lactobacillus delbrueckii]GHN59378.1 hypothetical protein ME805_16020 [Lactobacillus delbrueckii]
MNKKENLLAYLRKNIGNFVPSKELAQRLNVTTRTVRTYVKSLNESFPEAILADYRGYKLASDPKIIKPTDDDQISQRRFVVLRTILNNDKEGVDEFELAESLFISESSLVADITFLNKLIKSQEVKVVKRLNKYYLEGEEYSKRHLILNLLTSSEFEQFNIDREIQKILGDIKLTDITAMLDGILKRCGVSLNNYFLKNFVFHIAIAIDRANTANNFDNARMVLPPVNKIVSLIVSNVEDKYNLQFMYSDIVELSQLISIEIDKTKSGTDNKLVRKKIKSAVKVALQKMEQVYSLSFSDQDFIDLNFPLTKVGLYLENSIV